MTSASENQSRVSSAKGGIHLTLDERLGSGSTPATIIRMLGYPRAGVSRLIQYYQGRKPEQNNLDFLRMIFSFGVIYVHCLMLSGTEERPLPFSYSVDTAVQGFFLVSGYLVFSSYERSSTLKSYVVKRARRIYPAYFFVVMAAAFGLYFVSQRDLPGYFGSDWLKYVVANLSFLNFAAPTLPGVFSGNPAPAVNGALWTIKVEVAFYVAVPIIVSLMHRTGRLPVLLVLYLLSYFYYFALKTLAVKTGHGLYDELAKQFPGQLRYFVLGAAIFYYDGQIRKYLGLAGIVALTISCFVVIENLWFWKPILLAAMVFAVAFGPLLPNVGRVGDLSYGAYLFHFPIIQLAIVAGLFAISTKFAIAVVYVVVTILAYLCWHLLEKPFLAKSSHYLRAETPAMDYPPR